ncbi:hypothetical protein BGZ68_008270 [Mortierella alpina]|nr:hypothetical protein BGZ68_008270 [Mortierella alpina]
MRLCRSYADPLEKRNRLVKTSDFTLRKFRVNPKYERCPHNLFLECQGREAQDGDSVAALLNELRQGCSYHAAQSGLIPKGTRQRTAGKVFYGCPHKRDHYHDPRQRGKPSVTTYADKEGLELLRPKDLSRPIPVPSKEYLTDLGFEDLFRRRRHAMGVSRMVFNNIRVNGFIIKVDKARIIPNARRDYTAEEIK